MLVGVDLGKGPGSGGADGMAAHAERSDIGFAGIDGRIGSVVRQRTVAGFAVHVRVHATGFGLGDVAVAGFAGLVAGEVQRPVSDFGDSRAAVMSVLPKAVRDHHRADHQKDERSGQVDACQTEKMSRIPEDAQSRSLYGIPRQHSGGINLAAGIRCVY